MDTTVPELDVTVEFTEGKNIEITATATDDSGNAAITGTVNGKEVIFENGKAVYTPVGIGDYVIVVRAEDESGNYTEKTQTVTITEEDPVFELKLGVTVEKDNIKPDETTNLFVSTSSVLGEVSLSCTANGGTVTENEDGFSFVSDKTGTFELVVTATDMKGNTVSQTVYITVTEEKIDIGDDDEETGDYENKYTPEPRARVILDSNEKTETKMTEEMADLVDHLETPLAVYEYLYNNVNTEFYKGSRKGAIGTYEQNGGNDVDCASLLIAMLRYMGYEAEYVTGTVGVTEQQLIDWTGTEDIDDALKIWGIHGGNVGRSANMCYIDHTWVKTNIDGKEYNLDISFKKYKYVEPISDEYDDLNLNVDISKISEESDFYATYDELTDSINFESKEIVVSNRVLVQKRISKLPTNLPYTYSKVSEKISDIRKSKVIQSDDVEFSINGKAKKYYSSDITLYNINIEYVPNPDMREIFDILDLTFPKSIYELNSVYQATGLKVTAVPALIIDNKILYYWNTNTNIGDTDILNIEINSSNQVFKYSKELLVGSSNAIVFDEQVISAQELLTAYDKMSLSENELSSLNSKNVFDNKYLGNYLSLMGKMYFAELDIQNKFLSASNSIYSDKYLSFGVFSYDPSVKNSFYGNELETKGSFTVDIIGNTYSLLSLKNNHDDELNYHFASGYISSYLESSIIEQFTGMESVSTAKVLNKAIESGKQIKIINSNNIGKLDTLQLYPEDISIIKQAVNSGSTVIVPESNITLGKWCGVGYIIQNTETGDFSFKLTGNLNGGSSDEEVTYSDIIHFIDFCASVSFGDTVVTITQVIGILSKAIPMMLTGSYLFGGLLFFVASTIFFSSIVDYWLTLSNCERALDGSVDALFEVGIGTTCTLFFTATGTLVNRIAKPFLNAHADKLIVKKLSETQAPLIKELYKGNSYDALKFITKAEDLGLDTDSIYKLLLSPDQINKYSSKSLKALANIDIAFRKDAADIFSNHSEELIKRFAKSDAVSESLYLIAKNKEDALPIIRQNDNLIKAVFNLDDSAANSFVKTASKQDDAFFEAIAKSSDPDKVAKYVVDHGDGAAYIVSKFGNNGIDYADISSDTMYDILSKERGNRPDVSTYLTDEYIQKHLSKFENGFTVIQTNESYNRYTIRGQLVGNPNDNTLFVMPKDYCDKIFSEANGDVAYIEEALGFQKGHFSKNGGTMWRIDVDDVSKCNLRIPNGNETGASSLWIPGGYTSGGVPEAVSDTIKLSEAKVTRLN